MADLTEFYDRYPEWVFDSSPAQSYELSVHIFGPYRGDFHDILASVARYLQDAGYPGANICSQLSDHERPEHMSQEEKWWWESVYCMDQADAAIFIFFEADDKRLDGEPSQGLNSSVIAELMFWVHFFTDVGMETLVIFEEEIRDMMGSLVPGIMDAQGLEDHPVDTGDVGAIREMALTSCMEWRCIAD